MFRFAVDADPSLTAPQPEMALDVGFHSGFFGHLTEIANYIATSLPTFHFMGSYTQWREWIDFVEGPLESVNVILEAGYEGFGTASRGGARATTAHFLFL